MQEGKSGESGIAQSILFRNFEVGYKIESFAQIGSIFRVLSQKIRSNLWHQEKGSEAVKARSRLSEGF